METSTAVANGDKPSSPEPSAASGSAMANLLIDHSHDLPTASLAEAFESAQVSEEEEEQQDEDEEVEWYDADVQGYAEPKRRAAALLLLRERLRAQLTPPRILLRDKIAFTLGTLDLVFSAYWLGKDPSTFYILYTVKCGVMLALRFALYKAKRAHYYMLDLCYAVQPLLLLNVWAFPASVTLSKVTFSFCMGPLLWSILAFRNSLVYHSVDKVTSLFLHLFPAAVCLANRWYPLPAMAAALRASPALAARWESASLWELCVLPMGPYLLWAMLYYLKIFVVSSAKIQRKGYATLFDYVTSQKGIFAFVVLRFPRRMQPLAYLAMHAVLTLAVMGLNSLWWSNRAAGPAFVVALFTLSAYNGASFYFDVFAHRYLAGLGLEPMRQKSKSPRQAAAATPPPADAAAAVRIKHD